MGFQDIEKFHPNFSFASQNLRSLNISTKNKITKEKIYAVTKENADIIFICDLKLNSSIQKAAVHDVEKYFFLNGYKLYHNSRNNTRGVGILIHRKNQHTVTNRMEDLDGNIIVLELDFDGKKLAGSVYGPNQNDNMFFVNLNNFLSRINGKGVVLGGGLEPYIR